MVAPHVGAWIEISQLQLPPMATESHPTWVRGLKCKNRGNPSRPSGVAPHVGAWIEILPKLKFYPKNRVAPHVGAWIEMP